MIHSQRYTMLEQQEQVIDWQCISTIFTYVYTYLNYNIKQGFYQFLDVQIQSA